MDEDACRDIEGFFGFLYILSESEIFKFSTADYKNLLIL